MHMLRYVAAFLLLLLFTSCGKTPDVLVIIHEDEYYNEVIAELKKAGIKYRSNKNNDNSFWHHIKHRNRVKKIMKDVYQNLPAAFRIMDERLKILFLNGLDEGGIKYSLTTNEGAGYKILVNKKFLDEANKIFKKALNKLYSGALPSR